MDQELAYEFVRCSGISFWRSNPYFGLHKLATKLIPSRLPHLMLDEVVLERQARRLDALQEAENDKKLQEALALRGEALQVVGGHDAVVFLREQARSSTNVAGPPQEPRRPQENLVGQWPCTRGRRSRATSAAAHALPLLARCRAKMAFMNSQSLDQMSAASRPTPTR